MAMMAMASMNSVVLPVRLNSLQPTSAEMTAAAIKIRTKNWLN